MTADPLRFGSIVVDPPVVLAPMAGVTNAPFRRLCRRHGAGLYVCEMITARALVEGSEKTDRMARFDIDETPRSIQLYGTEPESIAEAARRLVGAGRVDHIDLNFGCPVPKVTRHGGGAALPVRTPLLARIIAATVDAAGDVPVTAKFRMGIDDAHLTHLTAGHIAAEEGCVAIALHARTAEQLYSGHARWDAIGELKAHVTTIPVLGNGDIWEASDAVRMVAQTGADGVVIGRGCLGRPWLFRDLADAFAGRPLQPPPRLGATCDTMIEHFDLLADWLGTDRAVRDFRKHTGWYLSGYPTGKAARRDLAQLSSRDNLLDIVARLPANLELTAEGRRSRRGHRQGPRRVALPDGWYESAATDGLLDTAAEAATSGG